MNLRGDLSDEDQDLADPNEADKSTQSANQYRLLLSNLPKIGEYPPEALPYENIKDLKACNLAYWNVLKSFDLPMSGSAADVCETLLWVEKIILEEYEAECGEEVVMPLGSYDMRKISVAESVFATKPYKPDCDISEKAWNTATKERAGHLAKFKTMVNSRAVFAGQPGTKIGVDFDDRASVIVCIASFAVDSRNILSRWADAGNECVGHRIIVDKYHHYRKVIEGLNTTDIEKKGFLYWLDMVCPPSHHRTGSNEGQ